MGDPCIYIMKYVLDTVSLGCARLTEYDYNSIGGSMNLITTIGTLAVGICGSMNIITTIQHLVVGHVWSYEYNYNYSGTSLNGHSL